MGASHSVESDAPLIDPLSEVEDPEPEISDSEEDAYEQDDDIRWLWPFI